MVQFNHAARELTVKLVYYGPGLSGKTTNLEALHQKLDSKARGRLLTVDTADDRTLFFDLMPVFFDSQSGVKVKLKLFTVPGQVIHNATRKVVLSGADGIVFVADSHHGATAENTKYWRNMMENLKENGVSKNDVPIVIQFNKLDLPNSRTREEIEAARAKGGDPVFGAVAIRGEGVLETLHGLLQLTYRKLDERLGLESKLALSEKEFLSQIFKNAEIKGTELERSIGGAP